MLRSVMPTLILTPRFTADAQSLWRAAGRLGWDTHRLATWRVPPELLGVQEPVFYLEGLFAQTIAAEFGIRLAEPPDDWLPRLPEEFRKRRVELTTLGAAQAIESPMFVKPPNDKSFPARVYHGSELPREYDERMAVLVAEPVVWEMEFRCFVLDRGLQTLSIYLRHGVLQREHDFAATETELATAKHFVESLLADERVVLPRAAVVDVGVIAGRGWAVVEQNAAWGSGIYGCDPESVLEVLRHATVAAHGRTADGP
jgi:hypothetical protein